MAPGHEGRGRGRVSRSSVRSPGSGEGRLPAFRPGPVPLFLMVMVAVTAPGIGEAQVSSGELSEVRLGAPPSGFTAAASPASAASATSLQTPSDFLFEEPRFSLGFRVGYQTARGDSDVFDFVTEELTLSREDFASFAFDVDLGIRASPRVEVRLGLGHARAEERSEFRDWVGDDDLPIEQETRLETTPLTAGVKLYLLPRGESLSRFVWIPANFAPYLAGGVGMIRYQLTQEGEFVDFRDLVIFSDHFTSSDWGPTVHVAGGGDFSLTPRVSLTGEARYRWAEADLRDDFIDFDPIDLSGFRVTLGVALRF